MSFLFADSCDCTLFDKLISNNVKASCGCAVEHYTNFKPEYYTNGTDATKAYNKWLKKEACTIRKCNDCTSEYTTGMVGHSHNLYWAIHLNGKHVLGINNTDIVVPVIGSNVS